MTHSRQQLLSDAIAFKPSLPASEIFPPVLHPGKLGKQRSPQSWLGGLGAVAQLLPCYAAWLCAYLPPRLGRRKDSFLGSQQLWAVHTLCLLSSHIPPWGLISPPSPHWKESGVELGKPWIIESLPQTCPRSPVKYQKILVQKSTSQHVIRPTSEE